MNEPLSPAQVAEIRARAEKATPGPWFVSAECPEIVVAEDPVYGVQVADCGKPAEDEYQPPEGEAEGNAAFTACARADVPALCDSYDAQARRIAELEAEASTALQAAQAAENWGTLNNTITAQAAEIERLKADASTVSHREDVRDRVDELAYATARDRIIALSDEVGRLKAKLAEAERDSARPKVICLCGSTRFIEQFAIQTWELERKGFIVLGCTLLPYWYCGVPSHFGEATGTKEQCDELHKRKIDLADEILVLNYGGYIGASTRSEIDYALATGKPVVYVEAIDAAMQPAEQAKEPKPEGEPLPQWVREVIEAERTTIKAAQAKEQG